MKTYIVWYDNYCVLFGNRRFMVEVEAEDADDAIRKAKWIKREYVIGNCVATEKK